jgi:hypothetical protein
MASARRRFEACEEEDAAVRGVSRARTPPVFLVVVLSPVAASLDAARAGTSVARSEECVECAADFSFWVNCINHAICDLEFEILIHMSFF